MKRQVEYFDLQPTLKISKFNCISSASLACLPACQPAVRPGCAIVGLQKFHTIKVMAADLRKCYSEDDLPTAPWRFPLSFIPFLVLYIFLSKVRMSPKVTIACNGFCLLRHIKPGLHVMYVISYSGTMFSRILVCTLLHRELQDYSLGQIDFAVFRALLAPVNKHNYYVSACKILCAC